MGFEPAVTFSNPVKNPVSKKICVKFPFYHCILPINHAWKMQYSKRKNRLRNDIITNCRYVEISCRGMKNILYVFNAWQARQIIDEKSVMEDRVNIMNLTGSLNKTNSSLNSAPKVVKADISTSLKNPLK